jgi:hypothetical protein
MWLLGGIALVAAGVLVILGVLASRRPPELLLGALLVYKYQLITEEQLDRALAEQGRRHRKRHRLGEILMEMELVTESQLSQVLEYQRSYERRERNLKEAEAT